MESELLEILKVPIGISEDDIPGYFDETAKLLFNEYCIKTGEELFRLTEIEFYLFSENHPDEYVHKKDRQKEPALWYFHGSGMDITFGNRMDFGGILLRGMMNIRTGEFISGPLNVVHELFKSSKSVQDTNFGLVMVQHNHTSSEKPVAVPRVGLNKNKQPEYCDRPYRYIIFAGDPDQKVYGKTNIARYMNEHYNYSKEELKNLFGWQILK